MKKNSILMIAVVAALVAVVFSSCYCYGPGYYGGYHHPHHYHYYRY